VVFGKIKSKNPKAKTLLCYTHYDTTSIIKPEDWVVPPHNAEIVDAERLNLPRELGKVIVARGVADKKGSFMAFLMALRAMLDITGDIPLNIIFAIEGEEELLSPKLHLFKEAYFDELKEADASWAAGSYQLDLRGRLGIQCGYKGAISIELVCKGGNWGGRTDGRDLWAGDCAMVDAPLLHLIHALASILGKNNNVLVEGFFDDVRKLTAEEKKHLKKIRESFDPAIHKRRYFIKNFKPGDPAKLFKNYIMGSFINVDGIVSGYTGPGIHTYLPQTAVAKIDIRPVPNQTASDLIKKIRKHLDKNGFSNVEIRMLQQKPLEWARTSSTDPWIQALIKAAKLHGVTGDEIFIYPTSPGSDAFYLFNRPPPLGCGIPMGCTCLYHGGWAHQANEYMTLKGYRDAIKYMVTAMNEYAKM
jgi:acetylornithine deacetylase/succinyl-diaminopimelate desuccinylase-like protein